MFPSSTITRSSCFGVIKVPHIIFPGIDNMLYWLNWGATEIVVFQLWGLVIRVKSSHKTLYWDFIVPDMQAKQTKAISNFSAKQNLKKCMPLELPNMKTHVSSTLVVAFIISEHTKFHVLICKCSPIIIRSGCKYTFHIVSVLFLWLRYS